jgi:hypothetical protein
MIKHMAKFPDIFYIWVIKSFMSHVSLLYVENVQIFCGHLNDFPYSFRVLFYLLSFQVNRKIILQYLLIFMSVDGK